MTNQPNQQVATTTKMDSLKSMMLADSVQVQFKNALGAENTGTFMASLIDLYSGDTKLQECLPSKVIQQALKAALLKLPINKSLGFAYIIPYKGEPTFVMGYKGYIQLAYRTNAYRILNADMVYEGQYRSTNKLTGEFDLNGQQISDKVVGYFAHFELKGGLCKTLYMTREEIVKHGTKYSAAFKNQYSPWNTGEFDAMAVKTVLRRLLTKWGFLTTEMAAAMDIDNDDELQDEIKAHANKDNMGFTNAEVVQPGPGTQNGETMTFNPGGNQERAPF